MEWGDVVIIFALFIQIYTIIGVVLSEMFDLLSKTYDRYDGKFDNFVIFMVMCLWPYLFLLEIINPFIYKIFSKKESQKD